MAICFKSNRSPNINPMFSFDHFLLLTYLEKPLFCCCLTPHWAGSPQAGLWLLLFSPCRCEPQHHTLPVKSDLASRVHILFFCPSSKWSSFSSQAGPCQAPLGLSSPTCLTCSVMGFPAFALLKGVFCKEIHSHADDSNADSQRTRKTSSQKALSSLS